MMRISLVMWIMENRTETVTRYKVNQLIDTGMSITLNLTEDVELERVSQQQLILDSIDNLVSDKDIKQQVKPFLEAILRAQPQTVVNTYSQATIQITMPKRRLQKIGIPQVGDILAIDIRKE
ncbi:MAG: hypothetical protein ACRD8Z_17370 [Nitrososphaeraceae archaeon]